MASIGKQHQELDEQGIGKCSVPEDNTSLPMEYIIRHGIGVSVPAPHPAPGPEESPELVQAVEQSENKQDCPSRLGDVVERLSNFPEPVEQGEQDNGAEELNVAQGYDEGCYDIPAPSQPELMPIDKDIANARESYAGGMVGKDQAVWARAQYIAAMREIQQLRQQSGKEMLAHQTAEKCAIGLQQQLAQIRDATFTTVGCWECPNAIQAAQTIAALKADNAQKDARIAELTK